MRPLRSLLFALAFLLFAWPARGQTVLVKPYLQPGPGSTLDQADVKVVCWITDAHPARFTVEYELLGDRGAVYTVQPERVLLDFAKAEAKKPAPSPAADSESPGDPPADAKPADAKPAKDDDDDHDGESIPEAEQHYVKYVARLAALPFDSEVRYRVKQNGTLIREATFRTRASATQPVRLAVVGDLANGKPSQNGIAFRIAEEKPDLMLALGDIVYPTGRVNQYMHHFWKTYNDVPVPGPKTGAPLMASVPMYAVLGNHDVAARFPAVPDALGAYYFFHPPTNGPGKGPWVTSIGSDKSAADRFLAATPDSYPALDAYSFDCGPVHVVVLNSNASGNVDQPKLRQWVEQDLKSSTARWKLAAYHNPAFSSSPQHYTEQSVRQWHPLFESCGVDLTLAGHVHNYQRTVPIQFAANSPKRDKRGRVDGAFVLDRQFDGDAHARPRGIIHLVAGGGGATLYGPGLEKTAVALAKEHGENYADYTAKMVVDRHSFVVLDIAPTTLKLRALDAEGNVLDRITIDKSNQTTSVPTQR